MTPIHTTSKGIGIYHRLTQEGNTQYVTQAGDLIWDTSLHDPEVLLLAIAADAAPACGVYDGDGNLTLETPDTPQRRVDDPGYEQPTPPVHYEVTDDVAEAQRAQRRRDDPDERLQP